MSKKTKSSKSSAPTKKASTSKKASSTKKASPSKQAGKSSSSATKKPSATAKKTAAKKPSATTKAVATKQPPKTVKKVVKKRAAPTGKAEKEGPLDFYLKAGQIAIKVKELLREKVKIGASVIEICEAGEAKIVELGGKWAFPLNVSINNVAAHYSSPPQDDLVIKKGDVVKVDCGVEIDGYVADTAFTISFNKDYNDLVKASHEATKAAVDLIRPGISTDRLGREIEDIIRSYDFRPIRELSGHQLDQNTLHGQITIPNVKGTKGIKLSEGQAFAIETFATTGTGKLVKGENKCFIFQLNPIQIPIRLDPARKTRKVILAKYPNFPFTTRWIAKELTVSAAKIGLTYLANKGQLHRYPVLSDIRGSFVSQSEHTVFLTGNSRVITTLPNQ